MNIGILGSGNMGSALGTHWIRQGHTVTFSYSHNPEKLRTLAAALGPPASVGTPSEAVQRSDVLLLAVWPNALSDVLHAAGPLTGKILITCVSGLRPDMQGQSMGLKTDLTGSMAEQIATITPGARVVEAFNLTFAEIVQASSTQFGTERASIPYCGDDVAAKTVVAQLIESVGFEPIDAGPLHSARSLETLSTLWVQFAVVTKLFPNIGLKFLRR